MTMVKIKLSDESIVFVEPKEVAFVEVHADRGVSVTMKGGDKRGFGLPASMDKEARNTALQNLTGLGQDPDVDALLAPRDAEQQIVAGVSVQRAQGPARPEYGESIGGDPNIDDLAKQQTKSGDIDALAPVIAPNDTNSGVIADDSSAPTPKSKKSANQ